MHDQKLLRLFPGTATQVSLQGLYLAHRVHEKGRPGMPFVYANFLTSLDGRIALEDTDQGITYVPEHLTTDSDFRLFMELHAQADCLITHGGYMRALSEKRLGNILQVGLRPEHRDLTEWRRKNGMSAQPAVVIASASLDFPMHDSLQACAQQVYIATGNNADPERLRNWRDKGFEILLAGNERLVQGGALIEQLDRLGFGSIYLIAGPHMLDTIVRDRKLSLFYQTINHQLIGGKDFHTLLPGPELGSAGRMVLSSLFYETQCEDHTGQFFARFEANAAEPR